VLLVYGSAPAALCALMGLTIGPPAGAIMALPAAVLPPHRRAFGLGIFYTTYYGVMAVGPAMAGWCRDHWQTAAAAILFGAIAYLAIVPLFLLFKISAASARAP